MYKYSTTATTSEMCVYCQRWKNREQTCLCENCLQNKKCGAFIQATIMGNITCANEIPCKTHQNKRCTQCQNSLDLSAFNNSETCMGCENWNNKLSTVDIIF